MTSKLSVTRIKCDIGASDLLPTGNNETAIHILTGRCSTVVRDRCGERIHRNLGGRQNIFTQLPTTIFIGPESEFKLVTETHCDILVAKYEREADTYCPTVVMRPADVQVHNLGEGTHARTVREIAAAGFPHFKIRLGETVNTVGGWSSWPVHAGEVAAQGFEEVFTYFCNPPTGFGIQVYDDPAMSTTATARKTTLVRSGDAFAIPQGFHPVVAAPDTQLMYVWIHASEDGFGKEYARMADESAGLYKI